MTKQNREQISYKGKDIFVGLDVHKKTYSVVVRVEGEVAKRWTTAASPQKLVEQLLKYFSGGRIHTAYEAGFSGLSLHRELEKNGIHNFVVHAAGVEVAISDRVKTDKRDAAKLASLLESNRLKGIRVLTEEEENHRQLSRTRQQLVDERTAVKNKIRMKFHQLGVIAADENQTMSHRWVKELLGRISSSEFTLAIEAYSHVWKTLDEEISKLEKALKQQAKEDPNEFTYRSAPGVGPLSARILSNELGDMSQFQNERQLFSYTGLTPSEYSSGEKTHRGHITRQGNSRVRAILVEVAWRAIGEDKALATFFTKLFPHTGKKRAIIAVACKLIGRVRAAFRHGEPYQLNYQG
ncbi:MAG: IS110 family transposase [Cyanobacteria bacterium P01_D01_bin.105]